MNKLVWNMNSQLQVNNSLLISCQSTDRKYCLKLTSLSPELITFIAHERCILKVYCVLENDTMTWTPAPFSSAHRLAAGKLQSASVANNVPSGHIHRRLCWWPQQRRQCNAVICSCLSVCLLCLCAFKMCNIWDGIKILTLIDWRLRLGINARAGLQIKGAAGRERHSSTSDGIHSFLAAVWENSEHLGNRNEMQTHFHIIFCQNQYSIQKIFHMIEWKRSWTNNSIFLQFTHQLLYEWKSSPSAIQLTIMRQNVSACSAQGYS